MSTKPHRILNARKSGVEAEMLRGIFIRQSDSEQLRNESIVCAAKVLNLEGHELSKIYDLFFNEALKIGFPDDTADKLFYIGLISASRFKLSAYNYENALFHILTSTKERLLNGGHRNANKSFEIN